MKEFTHLHVHSDYSLLDGAAKIGALIAKAKEHGMTHLALTDHGNLFGALRFYKACKKAGLYPIIGMETYVDEQGRHARQKSSDKSRYHMILLAKNETGYKNLLKLSSIAYTEGYYYKPRIDDELLEQYSEGLICLTSCIGGYISSTIIDGDYEAAKERAMQYESWFGKGNFYLELQAHEIPEEAVARKGLIRLSQETGIPLVATNDLHYVNKEDAEAHDIMLCIGTNAKVDDENRMKFSGPYFYLKSAEEMYELFSDIPEALENSMKIARMCEGFSITLPGPELPEFAIPEDFNSPEAYLKHLTYEGLKARYGEMTEEIKNRADYELDIIIGMGFIGYFLIVWDFIHYAHEQNIPVGPGRGSGAGSIVAYALKITDIDPLKYSLFFERFLNPDRVSMPDFDIDFCFERRGEVIDYVTRKYGKDRVAQIITFGTLKPKAVLKDVARALNIPFDVSNKITSLIPADPKISLGLLLTPQDELERQAKDPTNKKRDYVAAYLDAAKEVKEAAAESELHAKLFEIAYRLEGCNRHSSTHAAGVVIGAKPLDEIVPLYRDAKTGQISTSYTMDQLEECGLVKMDFLGLKTLTLIRNSEMLIRENYSDQKDFSTEHIPEDDKKTFAMLSEGKSTCIFQFESSGMQGILQSARPSNIEDLVALNALYRPGPMANIPQFIDGKNGKGVSYPHPDLEEVLKTTYGVIVYQEQVMQVGQIIGGFSLGKADIMRRAMGKKKVEEMDRLKIEFCEGAVAKGYSEKLAGDIFEMLKPFAGYGFNKSHAAAYSVLAYKTAYLKAHYPAEFMAANLTNEITAPDKLAYYLSECENMGIKVLPPSVNMSKKLFSVKDGNIVYGLKGIKGVGEAVADAIALEREKNGNYKSFIDFVGRVPELNKKVVESLILSGAMVDFSDNRQALLLAMPEVFEYSSSLRSSKEAGQSLLFDSEQVMSIEPKLPDVPDFDMITRLKIEKKLIGFYFSGHPLDIHKEAYKRVTTLNLSQTEFFIPEKTYNNIAMVTALKKVMTKKGKAMAFATISDYEGSTEAVIFPKTWELLKDKLEVDGVYGFSLKRNKSETRDTILIEGIEDPEKLERKYFNEMHIDLRHGFWDRESLERLLDICFENQGPCSLKLHFYQYNEEALAPDDSNDYELEDTGYIRYDIACPSMLKLRFDENFQKRLEAIPGVSKVWGA